MLAKVSSFLLFLLAISCTAFAAHNTPENRVASLYISQALINNLLALHLKSNLVQKATIDLDPEHGQIFLRGKIKIPVEELRAINLDEKLSTYRFQVALHPETTPLGHLILEFPLSETYFYPADSNDPVHDRVIIPVQLLSVALASIRGYLAALSGDFTGFNRRTDRLKNELKELNRLVSIEKNADVRETLLTQRESLELQMAAVPIERKQLQEFSKEFEHLLGFTGEKELNINNELGARKNALIFKIKLSELAPFLHGVELGGIRIRHDKKDGGGQNYLVIDINSQLADAVPPPENQSGTPRPGMKVAPSIVMRLNQSLFESEALVSAEKKQMSSKIRDLKLLLKDDGLHVTGKYHTFFIFNISFETVVDFVSTDTDTFEVRLREIEVAGVDLDFLRKRVLETMKNRLDAVLKGMCRFDYVGEEKDHAQAMRVTVDPKKLIPAFPDLYLVNVDVRDREFLLKIGQP